MVTTRPPGPAVFNLYRTQKHCLLTLGAIMFVFCYNWNYIWCANLLFSRAVVHNLMNNGRWLLYSTSYWRITSQFKTIEIVMRAIKCVVCSIWSYYGWRFFSFFDANLYSLYFHSYLLNLSWHFKIVLGHNAQYNVRVTLISIFGLMFNTGNSQ